MHYEQDSHSIYQHRALACCSALKNKALGLGRYHRKGLSAPPHIPETSIERRNCSLIDGDSSNSVLYLAYGSNLSNETFRGNRGIKPLSQINVQVPELRLTFDLPGIPYAEPCFANTARRDPEKDVPGDEDSRDDDGNKMKEEDYHKDRWHKGLIGVVYEVTPSDYAHIIATEGGGSAYNDVTVACYPFASSDPTEPVSQFPSTRSFRAHTLFAPAALPGERPPNDGGRLQRPDTAYAQASARYLKLITDGATECRLPYEYQDYLNDIRPYTMTTNKQRIGEFVFLSIWLPFLLPIFAMQRLFEDESGRAPEWLRVLSGAVFQACWASYDSYFKGLFGDGERTLPKKGGDDDELRQSTKKKWLGARRIALSEKGLLTV